MSRDRYRREEDEQAKEIFFRVHDATRDLRECGNNFTLKRRGCSYHLELSMSVGARIGVIYERELHLSLTSSKHLATRERRRMMFTGATNYPQDAFWLQNVLPEFLGLVPSASVPK